MARHPGFWSSILKQRCPRCRKGELFLFKPYNISSFLKMPERCPHCHLKYEVEPGFWWGAMYITYALNTGIFLAGLILYFIYKPPIPAVIAGIFVANLLFLPHMVRYSRTLMLYLFAQIGFSKECHDQTTEQNAAKYLPEHTDEQ